MKQLLTKFNTVLSSIVFIGKDIYRWDKSFLFIMLLYTVSKGISPFIWVFVPKIVIDELTGAMRINRIALVLVVAFILSAIIFYVMAYCVGAFRMKMNNIRYRYIHLLCETSLTMDYPYTEDSDTLDEVEIAHGTLRSPWYGVGGVIRSSFNMFGAIFSMFGFIAIIGSFNLIILAILTLTVFISYRLTDRVNRYKRSRRNDLSYYQRKSDYASRTMSDFKFGKDIRIYSLKNLLINKKAQADQGVIEVVSAIEWYRFKAFLYEAGLFVIREGLVYGYLVYSVLYRSMTVGNFVLYSVAVASFANWLKELLEDFAKITVQSEYVDDYRTFIKSKKPSVAEDKLPLPTINQCEIEFCHVDFKYPNSERYIFKDFSLKIASGQKLALVGVNGAGKTTLVKLLTGLYQPTAGEIKINGVNIEKYDILDYWKLFSVVYQDVHVFPFTLEQNITFSNQPTNRERLDNALIRSGLKSKVATLKNGLQSVMLKVIDEKGIELSGGENQKLATARALYKNGKILIMDEPTAALDPIAENELYQRLNEVVDGRTSIYISHRLASTRFCDVIAYLEDGKLVEYGHHDSLIAANNAYAKLFNMQASYYQTAVSNE